MVKLIDRADFWEFKGRCAEADLAIAKQRMVLEALMATKNGLVETFAQAHGFDPMQPLDLDDVTLTVKQGDGA